MASTQRNVVMPEQAARLIGPLAETQYDLETREVPRINCQGRPMLKVMVRPSFMTVPAAVRDLSVKGIGLLCAGPIQPGSRLAVLWDFGPPEAWRTLQARVARTTPCPRGGWVVGCTFDQRLQPADLESYLQASAKPTRTSRHS